MLVLGFAGVGIVYARTDVPDPDTIETNQVATIYYADGKTVLARVGSQNRSDVQLSAVPPHVKWAVLAAENRSFYTDPGISPKGITRAAWNNVRGGELQGGSTITQQYVKNVFTGGDRTFARKFKELFVTVKLDRQYSKDQILEWYLNTIYFGRGAYGVQAAAQVYFGKPLSRLTVAEGAVLASSIRSPALYDPQTHPEAAKDRWRFVVNGMVAMEKLAEPAAAGLKYPRVRKKTNGSLDDVKKTWAGHVVEQVTEELGEADLDSRLNSEGLRVVTTIDKKAQDAALAAVQETFADQPKDLRQALVAVKPDTGGVLAYYGGRNGLAYDYARTWRQPGSSFKPHVFATALQQALDPETPDEDKVSVYRTYDGSSPRTFPGLAKPVRNSENAQCNPCSVLDAMRRSINTVFYEMAIDAGPENVAKTFRTMVGLPAARPGTKQPTLQQDGETAAGIGIGQYEIRPVDQAAAFGVYAAGGTRHPTHFVTKVLDGTDKVVYEHGDESRQVLDSKVANDVTYAMKPVASYSDEPLDEGRESAAKTGTQQYRSTEGNSDAWMAGFTPQVSSAVWVGTDKPEGDQERGRPEHLRLRPARPDLEAVHGRLPGRSGAGRAHRPGAGQPAAAAGAAAAPADQRGAGADPEAETEADQGAVAHPDAHPQRPDTQPDGADPDTDETEPDPASTTTVTAARGPAGPGPGRAPAVRAVPGRPGGAGRQRRDRRPVGAAGRARAAPFLDAAAGAAGADGRLPRPGLAAEVTVPGRRLDRRPAVHPLLLLGRHPALLHGAAQRGRGPLRGAPGGVSRCSPAPSWGSPPRWRSRYVEAAADLPVPDVPDVQAYFARDRPAARAVDAGGHLEHVPAGRPAAVGRGDGRAVPAADRARVHELGPLRGRAGRGRAGRLAAAADRCSPACCSGSAPRRSSTRCCSSCRCSCCAGGRGSCRPSGGPPPARWSPGRRSTCRSRGPGPSRGGASSSSTGNGRPTSTRSGTASTRCSTGPAARRRTSTASPRWPCWPRSARCSRSACSPRAGPGCRSCSSSSSPPSC